MTEPTAEILADSGSEFELLAAAVACGATVRAAAVSIGWSERTAYRLSGTQAFSLRVAEMRSEIASEAVGRLSQATVQAIETLAELLSQATESKYRIEAAKLILGSIKPITELNELRHRLDKLEGKQ